MKQGFSFLVNENQEQKNNEGFLQHNE